MATIITVVQVLSDRSAGRMRASSDSQSNPYAFIISANARPQLARSSPRATQNRHVSTPPLKTSRGRIISRWPEGTELSKNLRQAARIARSCFANKPSPFRDCISSVRNSRSLEIDVTPWLGTSSSKSLNNALQSSSLTTTREATSLSVRFHCPTNSCPTFSATTTFSPDIEPTTLLACLRVREEVNFTITYSQCRFYSQRPT